MLLSEFDYILPKELIAQFPLKKRDSSRLMLVERKKNKISHLVFGEFKDFVRSGDLVVFNNTRVIPARILGYKKNTLGKVDVLLSKRISATKFEALIRPSLKIGQEILFNNASVGAKVSENRILDFNKAITPLLLNKIGLMPLPPYIKRCPQKLDEMRYQTVYAKNPGAIASPTAGLHFTEGILNDIKEKGADLGFVTLHVGIGTFKPVKCVDIANHIMEKEEYCVTKQVAKSIIDIKENGSRIFSVGTTTTRVLETITDFNKDNKLMLKSYNGYTDLFIYPGYRFKAVDCLLTNFHLPKTTLFMLVCAFAGTDLIKEAYRKAIENKYRFYSYGDAMLIV